MTATSLPGLDAFIDSMIALAVSIGFLVILLSMYTTVIERTRDIGILKSIGASKAYIIRALLGESAFICVIGIVAGHCDELCHAGRVSGFISDPLDSDHARLDSCVSALIAAGWRPAGSDLPRLAGQPQGRHRGPFLRLNCPGKPISRLASPGLL